MSDPIAKSFSVLPHHRSGAWESNDSRYRDDAHDLLAELQEICNEIGANWPLQHMGFSVNDETAPPRLKELSRKRTLTSDMVRIYAAMAIEGFLNFYGVLRVGQDVYDDHFERLGIIPKLRKLLLFCDALDIPANHQLCLDLDFVAQSRNALVHPKVKEVVVAWSQHQPGFTTVPGKANETVERMERFFIGFGTLVPAAKVFVNRGFGTFSSDANA